MDQSRNPSVFWIMLAMVKIENGISDISSPGFPSYIKNYGLLSL